MTIANTSVSFFDRPNVEKEVINVGQGVPFGMECISNPAVGIGGVYGTWGDSYDNETLPAFLEQRLGHPVPPNERLNLSELGFVNRHHLPLDLTPEEHTRLEIEVGTRFLRQAIQACNWQPPGSIRSPGPHIHLYIIRHALVDSGHLSLLSCLRRPLPEQPSFLGSDKEYR